MTIGLQAALWTKPPHERRAAVGTRVLLIGNHRVHCGLLLPLVKLPPPFVDSIQYFHANARSCPLWFS